MEWLRDAALGHRALHIAAGDVGLFDLSVLYVGHEIRDFQIGWSGTSASLHGHVDQYDRADDHHPEDRGFYI